MSDRFPRPCCGHLVFDEPPGSYEICGSCFWEDDAIQLRWPDWEQAAPAAEGFSAERAQQVLSEFMEFRHDIASTKDLNRERQPSPITWADFEVVGTKSFDL
ncbi:CPCC family cysteine-rich protein [Myceligenerans pegani]|uniref:Cysteine-rich CPCC domain-containing protein n=1 Tax=Myceligenerans pegani TaxID=2776917 RepID=A0ABR9N488_9MICO|nr:CPCC family cysteine-rich protein [Myceligenerans sp. TRM 65318]MBE1878479.1 hypothetical protein [Myceligenerans sp. TRM 65318]MBE3020750.1 hypothetical protein [Myceligenerans sp. TRM 65318]